MKPRTPEHRFRVYGAKTVTELLERHRRMSRVRRKRTSSEKKSKAKKVADSRSRLAALFASLSVRGTR